jgi:hypothetical protein
MQEHDRTITSRYDRRGAAREILMLLATETRPLVLLFDVDGPLLPGVSVTNRYGIPSH